MMHETGGCTIRLLTENGLETVPYRAESLADAVQYEPRDGVYTVSNTDRQRRVMCLTAHFDRLEASAAAAGIPLQLDRERVRAALRQMMAEAGLKAMRFRVTVSRAEPRNLILTVENFTPPTEVLRKGGVSVVTRENGARQDAHIKDTQWMHERDEIKACEAENVYEVILLSEEGRLLEGLGSNFYAIAEGRIWAAVDEVLPGIAQKLVLEIAPQRLPMICEGFPISRRDEMDEAFMTSSSRGIIPIVKLDGERIGDGKPGPHTLALQQSYDQRAAQLLEDL